MWLFQPIFSFCFDYVGGENKILRILLVEEELKLNRPTNERTGGYEIEIGLFCFA